MRFSQSAVDEDAALLVSDVSQDHVPLVFRAKNLKSSGIPTFRSRDANLRSGS